METSRLKRTIPILSWLPAYDRSWLTPDAIAGLTVWGLIVPQSMAFAAKGAKTSSRLTRRGICLNIAVDLEVGSILHQVIMNESVLDKPFGDVLGYRYMMQIRTFDFARYSKAKTSLP